jgi:hypothetical protein
MPFSDSDIAAAAREFWAARESGTQSARHDKPFLKLIADELEHLGWPAHISGYFADPAAIVAGHFRMAKSWDIVCRDSDGQPRICIEFKSQVDSYGNNENNRYEEALGSGLDIRARYGADASLGFFLVICDEPATRRITTKARLPDLEQRFRDTSHIDRRIVFAERIVEYRLNEGRLYDAAAILLVRRDGTVEHPQNPELWLANFPDKLARAAGGRSQE